MGVGAHDASLAGPGRWRITRSVGDEPTSLVLSDDPTSTARP
jgi:hypothetical protein